MPNQYHSPYAINRYQDETKRLYSVLDTRLAGREYLVGTGVGRFTIADINVFPWFVPLILLEYL